MIGDYCELAPPQVVFEVVHGPLNGQNFSFDHSVVPLGFGELMSQEDRLLSLGVFLGQYCAEGHVRDIHTQVEGAIGEQCM